MLTDSEIISQADYDTIINSDIQQGGKGPKRR